jgi:hypothetical protein
MCAWEASFGRALADLQQALAHPTVAQDDLLARLLARAAGTRWGEQYDVASIRTRREFQERVPLASYDDHAPYIDRMVAGEPDVLFPGLPKFIAKTSGTSGRPKLVAFPADLEHELVALIGPMLAARLPALPGYLDHSLFVSGRYYEETGAAGIPMGSASGFVRRLFSSLPHFATVPEAIFEETDHELRYYGFLLYTLRQPLQLLSSLNPSTLLTLFERALTYADALCADLRDGHPRSAPGAADAWPDFAPDPAAAARLRACVDRNGAFVATEVWPELRGVAVWRGGEAGRYVPKLLERCPGVELWPMQYSSSECGVAIPIERDSIGGVPALGATVLELFPPHETVESSEHIPLEEAEVGKHYRVAVTNSRGFYRYLTEDVSVVEGLYKGMPILQFSHRVGGTSSLTGEKLTPQHVVEAIEGLGVHASIRRYRVAPRWGSPPRYVLLVEPELDANLSLAEVQRELDTALRRINLEYDAKRASFRLAMIEIAVVASSYFDDLRTRALHGRSDAQYKLLSLSRELVEWPPVGLVDHIASDA